MRHLLTKRLSRLGCAIEPLEHRRLLAAILIPPTVPPEQTNETVLGINGTYGAFTSITAIGTPTPRAPLAFTRGNYTLTGVGLSIGASSDQFTFASRAASGDGSIIVRVASQTDTGGATRAGAMVRSSLSPTAAFAAVLLTPSGGVSFIRRLVDGGAASQSFVPNVTLPRFVKVTREGDVVSGYYSADGVTWTQVGATATVALGSAPRVGLAASSASATLTSTVIFSNVSLMLPIGTNVNDVVVPSGVGGYATYSASSNLYTIAGAGTDTSGDAIGFVHRSMLGNGSILATIDRFVSSPSTSSAGVAVRSASSAGAPFASLMLGVNGVVTFKWRLTQNGAVSSTTDAGFTIGLSLKLERSGNTIRAYRSSDRINWTQIGSAQSIGFASAKADAGLAILSGSSTELAAAELSGVSQLGVAGTDVDVGRSSTAGSPIFDIAKDTHAMIGRGAGIAATTDQFTFSAQSMAGDGDVVAYLSGYVPTNPAARAGLVIRSSADANAAFVGLFASSGGLLLQSRVLVGGTGISTSNIGAFGSPLSLKLTRSGNFVTAKFSVDGITWISAGSATVALGAAPVAGMALASGTADNFVSASFTGFAVGAKLGTGAGVLTPADQAFLNDLESRSVLFFYNETNASTGLVPDGANAAGGSPSAASSIASIGFGLSALAIADDRGFLSHADAYNRALTTLNFLYNNGAQVNGFFYHFLNPSTGARVGNTELSPIDTALLMAGVIDAGQHWAGTPLATVATNLFERVNWPWMQKPNGQFYGQWTPESGFQYGYGDFSEAALLYLLGLGSQTHPTSTASWSSWLRSPSFTYSGITFITAQTRALFTTQYPMGWFDLRGKTDSFGLNYFDNAQKAALAQRQMGINMAGTYPQWGANNWGWTAADGPTGYTVWGGPPATSNIDGTIVPTAPGGSLAFIPRQSTDALRNMQSTYPTTYRKYGFVDAFNPQTNWTSSIVLGIDVGMMLLAVENARSGQVWKSFSQSAVSTSALTKAFGSAIVGGNGDPLSDPQALVPVPTAPLARRVRVADVIFGQSEVG